MAQAPAPGGSRAELDPSLPTRHVTSTKVVAVRGADLEVRDDLVVGEEPLEIRAAGPRQEPVQVAVTMRTPGFEEELAIGFLTSEGLLQGNDVTGVSYGDPGVMAEPDDSVLVRLARRFDPSLVAQRNFVATASCGICGKASIDDIAIRCEPLPKGLPVVARAVITGTARHAPRRPRPRSSGPAGCMRRASSRPTGGSSRSARTSGATTRSTS